MPWDNKNDGPWNGNQNPWGKKDSNNGGNNWSPKNKGDDLEISWVDNQGNRDSHTGKVK